MKVSTLLLWAAVNLVCIAPTLSQSKTGQKLDKASKDLEMADTTLKTLTRIFKGKGGKKNKNNKEEVAINPMDSTNNPATVAKKMENGQLKAGDIAPDAKYLDVDVMDHFSQGVAVVRKGRTSGLIDSKGNFVVPFNTYQFNYTNVGPKSHTVSINAGVFKVSGIEDATGMQGYINASGKLITDKGDLLREDYPPQLGFTYSLKVAYIVYRESTSNGPRFIYYTFDGRQYKSSIELRSISEDIGIFEEAGRTGKTGYRTIAGQPVGNKLYDVTRPFQDGMAVVGQKDQYGEIKYGYINKQGVQVIPFMYSNEPWPFRNGFARIVPKDKSEFECAFINKTGKIVLTQTLADIRSHNGTALWFNKNGLNFLGRSVMDSTGKLTPQADFLSKFGITKGYIVEGTLSKEYLDEGRIPFSQTGNINPVTKQLRIGSLDLKTGKVVDAVFDKDDFYLYFDPVSKLAYATICTGKDAHGVLQYREGYINEDGLFVILKGSGSKW